MKLGKFGLILLSAVILALTSVQAFAVAVPSQPVCSPVKANPGGGTYHYVFVPDTNSSKIFVHRGVLVGGKITLTANVASIGPLSGKPYGMVVSPDGKKLYVSLAAGMSFSTVRAYDISNISSIKEDTAFASNKPSSMQSPRQIALTPDGRFLYIADGGSKQVYVIDIVKNQYLASSINTGEFGIYGLAIKEDGSRLAVSVARTDGSVLIYDISQAVGGTFTKVETISNLYNPTYLKYSGYTDSYSTVPVELLYVRVHEVSGDNADVRIYSSTALVPYELLGVARVVNANEQDTANNIWEGMDVSPNGKYLYVNHYRTSAKDGTGVYSYVFKTESIKWSGWDMPSVTDLDTNQKTGNGWLAYGPFKYLSESDSAVLSPDGSILWYAYSDGGFYDFSYATGFYDKDTGELNTPPGKPRIITPVTGQKDVSGNATWEAAIDDNGTPVYDVYYIGTSEVGSGMWKVLGSNVSTTSIAMDSTKLLAGTSYYLKVIAKDSEGLQSLPDSVGPFTMGGGTAPGIAKIIGLENASGTATTDAYVYDTIVITGEGFGSDPGKGKKDTATNNVKIYHTNYSGGLTIRDDTDVSYDGLQVWEWSDKKIKIGIPRSIGTTFIDSAKNELVVTNVLGASNKMALNVKPKIYSINPTSTAQGTSVLVTIEGTALSGTNTVAFGSTSAGAGTLTTPRKSGNSPDGTGANDQLAVLSPAALAVGKYAIEVTIDSQKSNSDVEFEVKTAGTPDIKRGVPNVAPIGGKITVNIEGSNFASDATVSLSKTGQTNLSAVVNSTSSSKINCTFDLTSATTAQIGKWDLVVENKAEAKKGTLEKGFTIADSATKISQIIDDFEYDSKGKPISVVGYNKFATGGDITVAMSTTKKYEGDQAAEITYLKTLQGFRGYNATLKTEQDLSAFDTLVIYTMVDTTSTGELKLQVTGKSTDGKTTANFGGMPTTTYNIKLSDTTFTKHTIPMSALKEVDDKGVEKVAGVDFKSFQARITDYQLVFTGNDASAGPIRADFVAAEGYTAPVIGDIVTSIKRDADTVGSSVTLSWMIIKAGVTAVDIYSVSGTSESTTAVYTTDTTKWKAESTNVSATTYTDKAKEGLVGAGYQKYYKVVPTGTTLTATALSLDVVGKFDLGVGPSDTNPERAFISLPLEPTGYTLSTVFGAQPSDDDAIAVIDNNFSITKGKTYSKSAWADISGITALDSLQAGRSYVYTTFTAKHLTVVGKLMEKSNNLTLALGLDSTKTGLNLELIANAFPTPVLISDSKTGLNGLTFGTQGGGLDAAQVSIIDANASIIGDGYAWHNGSASWVDSNTKTSTLMLLPGRGYIVNDPTITSFSWTQSK